MLNGKTLYIDTGNLECQEFLNIWYEKKFSIEQHFECAEIRDVILDVDKEKVMNLLEHLQIKRLEITDFYKPRDFKKYAKDRGILFKIIHNKLSETLQWEIRSRENYR